MRNTFSAAGAAQLISDVGHLCGVIDVALGQIGNAGDSLRGLKKLNEGLLLLGLDANAPKSDDSATAVESEENTTQPGLWAVEKRLFKDNESAREMLAELGIETLTEAEARSVLERRVEMGS